MLVLTRRQGEQIVIGDNILITVLAIEGNRVRLGLTAPEDVSILRGELSTSPRRIVDIGWRMADAQSARLLE